MSVLGAAISAAGNMIGFGAIIYVAMRPLPGQHARIWSVTAIPAAFNISIACLKDQLTLEQRGVGLLMTALVAGIYIALVMAGKLPPRPAGTGTNDR